MGDVVPIRLRGSAVLPDVRGEHRALQVTWHEDDGVVVLSTWRAGICVATVQLAADDAAGLIGVLAEGLARSRRR